VSGNTITIDGVLHSDYTVANAGVVGRAPSVTRRAGVEGFRFVSPAPAAQVTLCDECWITGVESDTSDGDSCWWLSRRGEMRQNYIHHSKTYSQGGGGYGLTVNSYTSDSLIEDNAINFFNKPFLFRSSGGGNVVGYNYVDGGQDSASPYWMEPDIDSHMLWSHMELVEGNLTGQIGLVNTWGGAGTFTVFRNRVLAQHQDPSLINEQTANVGAITFNAGNGAYSNVMGNVLGVPGINAIYENTSEADGYAATQGAAIFRLGNGSIAGSYSAFDVNESPYPQVPKVAPTVTRHGNFDYLTNSVKNDPKVALTTLPPSFYRTEKPAFFGSSTWPWVEPTGSTKQFTLPAKVRFDAVKK
jgi:hypothetical protein